MTSRYPWLPLFVAYTFFAVASGAASDCPASSANPFALTIGNVSIASQDTSTYGIRLGVGNPKQNVAVTPSTVVDNTLLISKNICVGTALQNMTVEQCRSYHGGMFDLTAAGASFRNVSITTDLPTDPGWTKFNPPYTVAGEADLGLVSNVAIPNMTVVVITEGVNFTAGHLGLGQNSVILKHLKDSNIIPSLGFGLNAGSQSTQNPRDGNLVLGGYDAASVTSAFTTYPIDYPETLAGRYCPLQVHIQGLQLLLEGVDPIQLIGEGDGHAACIEPYDNLFRLSETGLARFKQVTAWSPSTQTTTSHSNTQSLYFPEPGLTYPSTTGFNGSLKFSLTNGLTVTIPNSELQHPLRGIDEKGDQILQPNITELNIYNEPLGAWVLGKVFLSRVYLAVNYETQQIQLADVTQNDVTPSPVNFPSASAASSSCTPQSTKLAEGSIAAIVLGVLLGLVLIAGVGWYFLARKRSRSRDGQAKTEKGAETGAGTAQTVMSSEGPEVIETSPVNGNQLHRWELSSERRTSELSSPNGGHSLQEPERANGGVPRSRQDLSAAMQGRVIENGGGGGAAQAKAGQPWSY